MNTLLDVSMKEQLRSHDVLLACKLFACSLRHEEWTYASLSSALDLSAGEIHNGVERCRKAQVVGMSGRVQRTPLRDLLLAAPRIFYAVRGSVDLGVPTSTSASPLASSFAEEGRRLVVWPWRGPEGVVRGETLAPLHPAVPGACLRDPVVYEFLALVDVLRVGSADEQRRAAVMVDRLLKREKAA